MKDYVKSSPYFFRLIKRAMWLMIALLMISAYWIPAPLKDPANIARVPNPSKSAWFLLWIQELVGYSMYLAYPLILLGLFFFLLPYLPGSPEGKKARWLQRDQLFVNIITLVTFLTICSLTIIAMFFRGENWAFVLPF